MAYSYSKLSEFEACPYRYHQKRNLKIKEPESDLLLVGKTCHDIIETYCRHLKDSNQKTDFEKVPEIIESCCAQLNRPDLEEEITGIMNQFAKSFMLHDTFQEAEYKFGLDRELNALNSEGGWPQTSTEWDRAFLIGVIDRIDKLGAESLKITDYKSGWSTDVDKFQPQLYALALSRLFPEAQNFEIELDFIRFGIQKTFSPHLEDIIKVKKKLFKLVEEIESTTEWEPRVGNNCHYCGFINICPALKATLDNPLSGEIFTGEQAKGAAEKLLLLEAQLGFTRNALQLWVKANGPLIHSGFNFGYQVKQSDEITAVSELVEALKKLDGKLDSYLSVSAANKKKLSKDYPKLYDELRIVKKSTRWGVEKEKAEEEEILK